MKSFSKVNSGDYSRSPGSSRAAGIDMTPMVDVTFLLLIFFMVTASFTLQRAIAMPRQVSQQVSRQQIEPPPLQAAVYLNVDQFGGFFLMTPAGEQELLGKQSLVTALKSVVNADVRLEISVHQAARLQAMIDAIDAGTIAGFDTLTVKQTDNGATRS